MDKYSDYVRVDHSNKEKYWRFDIGDTSTRIIIVSLLIWFVCAPIAMVWVVMKCCRQKGDKCAKVIDSESADDDN